MDDESLDGYCGANPNAAREVMARRAARCAYCGMGAPQIILSDGMRGHEISCNQAVECGNDPSFDRTT